MRVRNRHQARNAHARASRTFDRRPDKNRANASDFRTRSHAWAAARCGNAIPEGGSLVASTDTHEDAPWSRSIAWPEAARTADRFAAVALSASARRRKFAAHCSASRIACFICSTRPTPRVRRALKARFAFSCSACSAMRFCSRARSSVLCLSRMLTYDWSTRVLPWPSALLLVASAVSSPNTVLE